MCLDIPSKKERASVYNCHGKGHNQYFEYHKGLIKRDTKYVKLEGSKITFKEITFSSETHQVSFTFLII